MVFVRSSAAKKSVKGEDFYLVEENLCGTLSSGAAIEYNIYAIFDGHGSQAVANYCKTELLSILRRCIAKGLLSDDITHRDELEEWEKTLTNSFNSTFREINEYACKRFERSGTTATVVCTTFSDAITRHLDGRGYCLVANVGDSNVFIDGGQTVHKVNVDHRLLSNRSEQQRIIEEGGKVEKESKKDPLRVWPGGLMMSRTLGDRDAIHAIPEPEFRSIAICITKEMGARVILASDGLWDAVPAKLAASSVRKKKTQVAAASLVKMAQKRAGKDKDDITVVVIDFTNSANSRPFEKFEDPSDSAVNRKKISLTFSSLQPVIWDPLSDPRPSIDDFASSRSECKADDSRVVEETCISEPRVSKAEEDKHINEAIRISLSEQAKSYNVVKEEAWQPVHYNKRKKNEANRAKRKENAKEEASMLSSDKLAKDLKVNGVKVYKTMNGLWKEHTQNQQNASNKDRTKRNYSLNYESKGSNPGADCLNIHGMDSAATNEETKNSKKANPKICRLYLKGKCSKGKRCKYYHDGNDKTTSDKLEKEMDNLSERTERQSSKPDVEFLRKEDSSSESKAGLQQSKICFRFLKGKCKEGKSCKYLHANVVNGLQQKSGNEGKVPDDQVAFKNKDPDSLPDRRNEHIEKRQMQIYLSGISSKHTQEDVQKYMEGFGDVAAIYFRKKHRGKYGFCLVAFADPLVIEPFLSLEKHLIKGLPIKAKRYMKTKGPESNMLEKE